MTTDLKAIFTRKELKMFNMLLKGEVKTATFRFVFDTEQKNLANTVACHIKNIRRKIKDNNLPYEIKTLKGHATYKLISLPKPKQLSLV
jgi:DNA-binding response OmpR family regulator